MWEKWRERFETFGAEKITFLTSRKGGAKAGKEITNAKCLLFYGKQAQAKEGIQQNISLKAIIEKLLCCERMEVLMHEKGDFEFPVKDSLSGVLYGTKAGHPMFEFIPTNIAESRGKDKHRPGLMVSRVFGIRKHRQRCQGSRRETTFSFSETAGVVFAVHLKGTY